jgi:hypothetical protein
MTTTTRTTHKASWAAVLTALLAVLALVFGAMTMAATATADPDPDKTPPGQSQGFVPPGQDDDSTPPGQDKTPPGQEPGDTPGSSHDKLTICHKVEGLGETGAGWNIITMNEQAWAAHQAHHASMDFVVTASTPCPPVTPQKTYCPENATANAGLEIPAGMTEAQFCNATVTTSYTCPVGTDKAGTVMDHAFVATNPADVAFCDVIEEQAAAIAVTEPEATEPEATELEAVAPVLPATVAEETAAVPAPATVPAAVPAGDGSSVPQVPMALFAALALATVGAVTSALRMATSR